ncbi:MAG: OmpH family outer membrane protein [Chitinophagaceae bacterium]|nr:OmpH family outer membrane protein [Chitinophagaceae bacterium]
MKKITLFICLGILISCLTPVFGQSKIGYVSSDEVFGLMPDVKAADTYLANYQKELANIYQNQQSELDQAVNKFMKDSVTMNSAVKEAKRKDLQDRIAGMGNKEQELNKLLEEKKEALLKPIREKLLKAIQDVAKEKGYQHILYREQAIVYPPADDITGLVKKKLGIQ